MTTYYNYLGQAMAVSADPTTFIAGNSAGHETITAPTGPSAVSVNSGDYDTLIASNGDNIFYVDNSPDVVQAASGLTGIKTIITGSNGSVDLSTGYTLPDNVQNLTFYGAGAWGVGNSGDNLLVMGANASATYAGAGGNVVIVAGFGQNSFQFEAGSESPNHDVFYGFHADQDTVRITGVGITSNAQNQ